MIIRNVNTCGDCRFYDETDVCNGECFTNPPVIVCLGDDHAIVRPAVNKYDIACRFWTERGAS